MKVGSGVSSNWNVDYQSRDRGREVQQRTLNGLGVDRRVIDVEAIEECGNTLRSGVRRSRVRDRGDAVPYGDTISVRQSSISPVAPEWTIDDDSNGFTARDRFNLRVHR